MTFDLEQISSQCPVPHRAVYARFLGRQEALQSLKSLQEARKEEDEEASRALRRGWQMLRCCRMRQLNELRKVYPLQQCGPAQVVVVTC